MKIERDFSPEIPQLDISSDFVMPKKPSGDTVKILNLDPETSGVLSTDISDISIPTDPKSDYYQTLGELVTSSQLTLSRTYNIKLGRQAAKDVLTSLFSLDIDYTKIANIRYGEVQKATTKYPHPKSLNKKTSPEVRKQIGNITAHTLRWYNGKSIDELLAGALPTQTFWDFAIICLKNGIKLNP